MSEFKPTVVFDFDGVIHSYTSPWQGADIIPDPPVPGIAELVDDLRREGFRTACVSTRCAVPEGMEAVKRYLKKHQIHIDDVMKEKPPAVVYIDDRAICFKGTTDGLVEAIKNFKPWNR